MKKLLIIIMLLLSLTCFSQNQIDNKSIYNVDRYVSKCLAELDINNTLIQIIPVNCKINGKYDGVTVKSDANIYTIWIRNCDFVYFKKVLAHELCHVAQYERGLTIIDSKVLFNGLTYKSAKRGEYYNRPHEIEARKLGYILYNKYKKY